MKNILKFLSVALLSLGIASCEKEENKVYFEEGTAPILTASSTTAVVLTRPNAANQVLSFNWTNPNYRFNTGVSSQDVGYVLEVDSATRNFSSSKKQEISIARELTKSFTVKELNDVLNKMELQEDRAHTLEFRIKSTLANNSVPLFSNVIKITVTPYLDVAVPVPTNGTLWIVGDAATSGWTNPLAVPYISTQKFTQVSTTLYELTLDMPGGGNYKLIQINGDWASQYHMLTGGTWSAGEFEKRDADPGFPGPPTAGTYKITVNFRTGKYTVVKL